MSAVDVVTGSVILGLASWLLYRSLWRRGGTAQGAAAAARVAAAAAKARSSFA